MYKQKTQLYNEGGHNMFKVLLVDEVNGNCYKRFECEDLFAFRGS